MLPLSTELDGMRAIAASMVFLVHFAAMLLRDARGATVESLYSWMVPFGYMGVDVFFVLSGFLIYGSALKKSATWMGFLESRLRRIYPAYLAVLGFYLLLLWTSSASQGPGVSLTWKTVIANALMLPGVYQIKPIISVAWSLSYELHFYLVMAIAVALRIGDWNPRNRLGVLVATASMVWLLSRTFLPSFDNFLLFFPGALAVEFSRAKAKSVSHVRASVVLAILALGLTLRTLFSVGVFPPTGPDVGMALRLALIGVPVALYCASVMNGDRSSSRILGGNVLRTLGECSYSFYLIHGAVINLLARTTGWLGQGRMPQSVFWLSGAIAFAAAWLFARGLYLEVELRFQRRRPAPA